MSSTATISAFWQACARPRWEVPDGDNIAADAFASSHLTGRVWPVNRRQEM